MVSGLARAGEARAWDDLRETIISLKRAGWDNVLVCFDSNDKSVFYHAKRPHHGYREGAPGTAKYGARRRPGTFLWRVFSATFQL